MITRTGFVGYAWPNAAPAHVNPSASAPSTAKHLIGGSFLLNRNLAFADHFGVLRDFAFEVRGELLRRAADGIRAFPRHEGLHVGRGQRFPDFAVELCDDR